jgi:predicted HD phosphohydrolase
MTDDGHDAERATFHAMENGTQEDWSIINRAMKPFIAELPDRVLAHLKMLAGDCGGFAIDRLEHCLQTATRAFKDGRDEEYVVCALVHDIGDVLGPRNHAEVSASIVKPFVSEQNHWLVEKHAVFQGYYFFHYLGLDRNMRDQFLAHPWYDYVKDFCSEYDGPAFDPKYKSMALEDFEPMMRRVFSQAKNSIYVPKSAVPA